MLRLIVLMALAIGSTAAKAQSLRELCERFEQAEFSARYRCAVPLKNGPPKNDVHLANRYDRFERATQRCRELLNFSLSNKRVRVDSAAVKRCIEARRSYMQDPARTKAKDDAMRSACDAAVSGLQQQGMSCDSPLECARGLSCLAAPGKTEKTCTTPLPKGSFCDDDAGAGSELHALLAGVRSTCEPGTYCGPASGAPGWKCIADVKPAKPRKSVGEACQEHADCRIGNFCASGKCAVAKAAGGTCSTDEECKGYCKAGRCAASCGSG